MGTWGFGITQDDTVAEVLDGITTCLKAGDSLEQAVQTARLDFAELEGDDDTYPLLWLGIAAAQWKYGAVTTEVLHRVRSDVASERGLDLWREDPKSLARRKASLEKFLFLIEQPNPKPSPLPKLIVRKAPFHPGDCLSILLSDGRYTAALVLGEDNSEPRYGKNLVFHLNYDKPEPPTLAIFEKREWLILTYDNGYSEPDLCWYLPFQLRKVRKRIMVIGNIALKPGDPQESRCLTNWHLIGSRILWTAP
jgi:hypothetical protein